MAFDKEAVLVQFDCSPSLLVSMNTEYEYTSSMLVDIGDPIVCAVEDVPN